MQEDEKHTALEETQSNTDGAASISVVQVVLPIRSYSQAHTDSEKRVYRLFMKRKITEDHSSLLGIQSELKAQECCTVLKKELANGPMWLRIPLNSPQTSKEISLH